MLKNDKLILNYLKKIIFGKKIPKNFLNLNIKNYNEIDSLKIFKILITIESKFGIKFKDNEIFSKNFNTLKGILELIKKKIR